MAYALRAEEAVPVVEDELLTIHTGASAKVSGLGYERRLRELGITHDEYKQRVRVLLAGHKIGTTSDEEIEYLLTMASPKLLALMESTWNMVGDQFQGWKVYDGYTIDAFRSFVQKHL